MDGVLCGWSCTPWTKPLVDGAARPGPSHAAWTELRRQGLHHKFLRELVLSKQVQGEAVCGPPVAEHRGPGVQLKAEGAAARERRGAWGGSWTQVIQAAAVLVHAACRRLRDLQGESGGGPAAPPSPAGCLSHEVLLGCPRRTPQKFCALSTLNADLLAALCTPDLGRLHWLSLDGLPAATAISCRLPSLSPHLEGP